MSFELNTEQQAAVEAVGRVFVSAGAGTGKTAVLVERFVRAVCDEGLDVDSLLVITYTKRTAGELRARIRAELAARGRLDLARRIDSAWISTIHAFCNRLLKTYPFQAGLDPRFRELDEPQAAVLRAEAFERALEHFCSGEQAERLTLLASYGSARLRSMLTSVYELLRAAGRELVLELGEAPSLEDRLADLTEAASRLARDPASSQAQRTAAEGMLEYLAGDVRSGRLLELSVFRARGERAATYEETRKGVEQAALDVAAAGDRDLLQELLDLFANEYAAAKERESALDFEDLQLHARDLLRDHEEIRAREQLRFREIMVDEFQDTNRLQCELVDLMAAGPGDCRVFTVGDEFQSIYGFRHADVQVFRERRAAVDGGLALSRNYRSRPEVLEAVNYLFSDEFGGGFQPLAAAGEFSDPVFGHPVELLVTDKAAYAESADHWRRGEARAIARRVRELVDAGAALPGEIVLLFAAGTNAEWYEEELRAEGLPTYRATGRGYFGQQQVADLLAYLSLLHNRYDDRALVTVLASPFVGVSNDALVLIRRAAGRRPLFTGVEHGVPPGLDERDARLVRAFRQRFDRLVALSERCSLERVCDQVISEHDYDLAVLARWDGRRRYANLRKLGRLARSYEELRGADVEGFVRFVHAQEAVGARELEALAEEEGADAVRLLTIHSAKGLEFKVVIVADAGRDRQPPHPDEILALSDGRFGFQVADPGTSKRRGAFAYDEVREAREDEERAERLRLYYVAMTRAVDRLIVSGALDLGRQGERVTPIDWVLSRLGALEDLDAAVDGPLELVRGEARWLVRVDRGSSRREAVAEVEIVEDGQLQLFEASSEAVVLPAPELPALEPIPEAPLHRPRTLSYSALALFEQCSYKYFARYVAGMRERRVEGTGLGATAVGSAVHELLEGLDLRSPAVPSEIDGRFPEASAEEIERIAGFVADYCDSDLGRRVAELEGARSEQHFAFEHDTVLVHGFIDVLHREGGRALVVDFKTNALGETSPAEVVESEYRLQTTRLRACLPARRRRRGRGRLPVSRAPERVGRHGVR